MFLLINFSLILVFTALFVGAKEIANPCKNPKIDAIIWSSKLRKNTSLLIFNQNYFYEFDFENEELGEGRRINEVWSQIKTPIDGATALRLLINKTSMKFFEEEIMFFKDPKYWVYKSKEKYDKNEELIRSGIFKFYGVHNNHIHKSLSFTLSRKNPRSPYRTIYTGINNMYFVCGSLERKQIRMNEYEMVIGDPSLNSTDLAPNVNECKSYGKKYGDLIGDVEKRLYMNRLYLIHVNEKALVIAYSDDSGTTFKTVQMKKSHFLMLK
ncbi:hypothetical protein B4U79_18637 [Dinothrombium tinctorium]|uniref:Uncharacterized protein n=1 Tax=Dinothrombium tinctorium TaxID=1965070 RepID=A0A443QCJ5_9ACAR|nr:hypothetical protein B4U79_18637 [Dinothrombium tinctorium]